ncbi:hypothetical protein EVA_12470, partial [gut metagenome]
IHFDKATRAKLKNNAPKILWVSFPGNR